MIELRPYQEEGIAQIRDHFRAGRNKVILCLPTGAGKTVVFSALAQMTLQKSLFAKVLILTHRIELLTQAGGTLSKFGLRVEEITADNRRINRRARLFVAMVETWVNRARKMPDLAKMDLVIVDECHFGNFRKVFELLGDTRVIGATATPISAVKKDPLCNYYDAIVCPVQIPDLVDSGFLMPAVTYSARIDRSALRRDSTGEYSSESQMKTFDKRTVFAGLISQYRRFGIVDGRPVKALVFNVGIEHSQHVTAEFNAQGIVAHHVDGTTPPEERAALFRDYRAGLFPVLCNVGIATTGFDDPSIEMVVINRATTSVPLWLQMCGRGSRLSPGKDHFKILDMGENYKELGLWEAVRPWEGLWKREPPKDQDPGIPPVKSCPACDAIVPAGVKVCPECGAAFPEPERPTLTADFTEVASSLDMKTMDKREVWPTLSITHLDAIRQVKDRKKGWVIHVLRERAEDEAAFRNELKQLRDHWKYKPGWENHIEFNRVSA